MRTWNLRRKDPLNLILAADSRLAKLDYSNDHIWEVLIGSGEPAAISLQTTYGLRARSMRIFPQFTEAHQTHSDPAEFEEPPTVLKFAPNYLKLKCEPFLGLEVQLEYWMPDSQTAAGRIWVKNTSELPRKFRLELTGILNPSIEGKPFVPRIKEGTTVLQGSTENLAPILFITGGATGEASPHPNLHHNLELAHNAYRRFTWVLASLEDDDESFRHARLTAAQNWDAEIGRIKMLASQGIEIETGDPDWDAALAFSKNSAYTLRYSPSEHLKHPSFVSTRLPDQGYSQQGSGAEYNHLWSGQTPIEAWHLAHNYLPEDPKSAKGLLNNFIDRQAENGFIDHKIGLGGQHSGLAAAPFLVSLAWEIYQHTRDLQYLRDTFRPLMWHLQTWFWEDHDRDGDGIPEWSNVLQTGYDDNPAFSRWQPWAAGIDIRLVESPDLCAYLYREITLLGKIAELIGEEASLTALSALASNLHTAVQNSWNGRRPTFQYWDRESHHTSRGETLKERTGPGELLLDLVFDLPTRLQIRLESQEPPSPKIEISIHGRLENGQHRVETITGADLTWSQDFCIYTLPNLYAEIEHLHIQGLSPEGQASLQIVDLYQEDHTLLTPIWAGIPTQEQLDMLIDRKLQRESAYGLPYGLPAQPSPKPKAAEDTGYLIWLPWNAMVAEGLLEYGQVAAAADLFSRNMSAVIQTLKREQNFRAHYHAVDGTSFGQRNQLIGLPPVSLFLAILGIRLLSPDKIEFRRLNPFPWPVKLTYRGTTITCTEDQITVQFIHGEAITISEELPCTVEFRLVESEQTP